MSDTKREAFERQMRKRNALTKCLDALLELSESDGDDTAYEVMVSVSAFFGPYPDDDGGGEPCCTPKPNIRVL